MEESQLFPPTCCFLFGLWLGTRLLECFLKSGRDALVLCEHVKSIVFSNQVSLVERT